MSQMKTSLDEESKLSSFLSLSYFSVGLLSIVVAYSSSAVIVYQAAQAAGATPAQISSWFLALGIGMGVCTASLSWVYKTPIVIAWSTPGAALLVTSLSGVSLNEAVGAFIFSSLAILICGITGLFNLLMRYVHPSLAGAMLAGVLLQFGLSLFEALETNVLVVGAMLAIYFLGKQTFPRYTVLITLLIGVLMCVILGEFQLEKVNLEIASPVWVWPVFTPSTIMGVGIPLFIVTMASQNMPGVAVLRANNYEVSTSPIIATTGVVGIVLAPLGGFAFNLAAITAAICMGKDAGENPKTRYFAALWAACFYLIMGILGATVVSIFSAFPSWLSMSLAGLALLSVIGSSLSDALKTESDRDAAIVTFLFTASGISLLGVSSAFWGLVAGICVVKIKKRRMG